MKKKIILSIIIILLIIIFILLKNSNYNDFNDNDIIIESSFSNYAKIPTYKGTIICNNGDIYSIKLKSNNNFITHKKLKHVSSNDLEKMKSYISEIESNYNSKSLGADIGTQELCIYKVVDGKKEKITLEASGDNEIKNTSENTKELILLIKRYI